MKVTKHGMGGYRTGDHPSRTGWPPQYQAYKRLVEAAAVAPLRPHSLVARPW